MIAIKESKLLLRKVCSLMLIHGSIINHVISCIHSVRCAPPVSPVQIVLDLSGTDRQCRHTMPTEWASPPFAYCAEHRA